MKIKDTIEDKRAEWLIDRDLELAEHQQGYYFDSIKHVHLLDGNPLIGTSSLAGVLNKPLVWWSAGLAVAKFGWINKKDENGKFRPVEERLEIASKMHTKVSKLSDMEYLDLLDDAYKAHSVKLNDSAEQGTDMHSVMEEYVKECIKKNEGKPIKDYKSPYVTVSDINKEKLQILVNWSVSKVKKFLWSEVNCYSKVLGIGGISDCGFEDLDGKYAILDFKSSKEVYLSQFWQCIAYAMQLEENGGFTPNGIKVLSLEHPIEYVAILAFGMKKPEVQYNYDVSGGKDAVKAMLTLYTKLPH